MTPLFKRIYLEPRHKWLPFDRPFNYFGCPNECSCCHGLGAGYRRGYANDPGNEWICPECDGSGESSNNITLKSRRRVRLNRPMRASRTESAA